MAELTVNPAPSGADAPNPAPVETPAADRPAWLPEGFDSPEALASAYAQMKTAQDEPNKPAEDAKKDQAAKNESVAKFVQDAGFDPVELSKEIAAKGDISPEAKTAFAAKLEEVGLSPALVDDYITGQKAAMDAAVKDIMSVAGGEQGYLELAEWAKETLSDAELQAFINIMESADVNTAKLTLGNLHARYRSSVPSAGKRLKGGTGVTAGDIFHSWEQQLDAQKDPRYSRDPAFRAEVEQKIERTLRAGGYKHANR